LSTALEKQNIPFWDNPNSGLAHHSVQRNPEPRQVGSLIRSPGYRSLLASIKQARIESGLTQEELASKVGRPQSFIAKIESGERRIDVVELIVLARFLGADLAAILSKVQSATPKKQSL